MVEMDPRLVSLACIYLASKAEECPVQAKSVLKCVKAVQCGTPTLGPYSFLPKAPWHLLSLKQPFGSRIPKPVQCGTPCALPRHL